MFHVRQRMRRQRGDRTIGWSPIPSNPTRSIISLNAERHATTSVDVPLALVLNLRTKLERGLLRGHGRPHRAPAMPWNDPLKRVSIESQFCKRDVRYATDRPPFGRLINRGGFLVERLERFQGTNEFKLLHPSWNVRIFTKFFYSFIHVSHLLSFALFAIRYICRK